MPHPKNGPTEPGTAANRTSWDRAGEQTVLPLEEFVKRIAGEIERRENGLAPGEESQSNQST